MKIAIPTVGSLLDEYMTSCEFFTIYSVNEYRMITKTETICTPQGCDCHSNIPALLEQAGVTIILSHTMPELAYDVCKKHGITIYNGFSGEVQHVAENYLKSTI